MKRTFTFAAVAALIVGVSLPAAARSSHAHADEIVEAASTDIAGEAQSVEAAVVVVAPAVRDGYTATEAPEPEPSYSFVLTDVPTYLQGYFKIWPANGPVNDGFGYRDGGEFHGGIDIMAPAGSTVFAAAAGVVVQAGYDGGWGNYVKIDHGGGVATLYAHMMDGSLQVGAGQSVAEGTPLGAIGATGYATAFHLHFEVYLNGSRVDPMPFLG